MSEYTTRLARRPLRRPGVRPATATANAETAAPEDKELDAIMGDGASQSTIPDTDAAALLVGSGCADGLNGSGWVIAGYRLRLMTLADLLILLRTENPLVTGREATLADKLQAACEVLCLCSEPSSRNAQDLANSPDYPAAVSYVAESIPYGPESFELLGEVLEYLQSGGATRVAARNPTIPGLPPSAEGNDSPPPGQSV